MRYPLQMYFLARLAFNLLGFTLSRPKGFVCPYVIPLAIAPAIGNAYVVKEDTCPIF